MPENGVLDFTLDATSWTEGGATERQLLIAAIKSDLFLDQTNLVGIEPFAARPVNIIWKWCVDYYGKFRKAPNNNIGSIFAHWAETNQDRALHETIDRLLSSLALEDNGQEVDVPFCLDLAQGYFNRVLLTKHKEQLEIRLSRGDVAGGLRDALDFKPLDLTPPPYIDLLRDKDAQRTALEESQRVLIRYKDGAGLFFGDELSEDAFVAFMAPSKGAKSFWLLDLAWRALAQGRRVAYFQAGDMTKNQVMRRFHKRAARRPIKARPAIVPIAILPPARGSKEPAVVETELRQFQTDLTWAEAEGIYERLVRKTRGSIRLSCHPTRTLTAAGIARILEAWDRSGWQAEVVVVDYAGNLAPNSLRRERTDLETADTWAELRRISEARHCLVATAQQSNKEGFRAWVLTRNNFRDSLMILAHVTAFFGINQTDEEKQRGIIRLNAVVSREGLWSETQCLYCGAALDIGNPCAVSVMGE